MGSTIDLASCLASIPDRRRAEVAPLTHASFERVASGFRVGQFGPMGVARLKLCFMAHAVSCGFLFQAVEERAGALRQCGEMFLRELFIERSAFYGD